VLDSVLEPVVGIELPNEVFTSRARWMFLIVEWNTSINMFYLLKNILLLIIVIFKLKCNNLIFNEIMVLNASYVCLYAFSLHRESPDLDPGRWTPHFWCGFVTAGIWFNVTGTKIVAWRTFISFLFLNSSIKFQRKTFIFNNQLLIVYA
jgi:hypothetical protein